MGPSADPAPLHVMNQNLLLSYVSRGSVPSERPPSPFSDSDSDDPNPQNPLNSDSDNLQAPLLMDEFHFPDDRAPNYAVLNTRFNQQARQNLAVPYPREKGARKLYTDEQRSYAAAAQVPQDSADFARTVRL